MGNYVGDYRVGKTFYHRFTTANASGVPTTLGNTPSCEYYVDGGTTAFTGGLTLTTDFNTKTGLNSLQVIATTSCTGIASGKNISVQVAAGTVSGISLVGYPVIEYSLENRSPLMPTTSGETLAVTSGVAAANVTSASINIGAVVTAVNTVVPARVTAQGIDIGAIVTAVSTIVPARVTAQGINIGAIVTAFNTIAPANVTSSSINIGAIVTSFNTIAPALVTSFSASGLAKLFLTDSGTTYASAVAGSVVKEIADNAGGSSLTVAAIVSGTWNAEQTSYAAVSGSFGKYLNAPVSSRLAAGASGLASFFLTDSGTNYAAAVTGSVVKEITDNAGTSATGLASIVWEAEQTANGTVAGSFGKYLDTAISSRLAPSVSGRSLLVSSTGYAGIDWNSIGTPGATQNLSATTIFVASSVTNNVGAVVTAVNTIVPARVTAQGIDVGAIVTSINTIAPARVTAQGIDIGAIVTAINTIAPARVTAQGINVGAVVTAVATSTAVQSGLAVAIWDAALSGHLNAGSTGEALNAAGGAGDPWITSIPGAYTTGQAGHVLGSIVQAGVTAIQAKTTGLNFTVSGQVDANIQYVNDAQVTGTGTSVDPWGP